MLPAETLSPRLQEELARDEPRAVVAPIDAPAETKPLLITDRILQANRTS